MVEESGFMDHGEDLLPPGVTPEQVADLLDRICASREFAQSERMRRFLRFSVERALAGDRDSLKEYTIGMEVFDRPSDYDPRVDSIVRVEARRLRRKLKSYYEKAGSGEAVVLTLPEGSYAPAFERPATAAAAPQRPADAPDPSTLAVLPFVSLSSDPENEHFADGLTEELISTLAQALPMRVAARTSTFQFKNQAHDIRAIGEILGVAKVLEGSVRRSGASLRVTAQLVNVADGLHLWSQRFDRKFEDIFSLQEEIAGAIAGILRVRLAPGPAPDWRPSTVTPASAIVHMLEGRHAMQKLTPASLRLAHECFQRAIAEDARFAAAYAGLAACLLQMALFGDVNPASIAPQARMRIRQALDLDENIAWPHICQGFLKSAIEWDYPDAEAAYRKAIDLHPGIADAHHYYATTLLAPLGRFEEAEEHLRAALAIDPGALVPNTGLGIVYYLRGDNEAALEQFEATLALNANYYGAHRMMAYALLRQGDTEEAVRLLESAQALAPGDSRLLSALGYCYGRAGRSAAAEDILTRLLERSGEGYVANYDIAMVYLGLGRLDDAAQRLEAAVGDLECWLLYTATDPVFSPLRGHPAFRKVVARVLAGLSVPGA